MQLKTQYLAKKIVEFEYRTTLSKDEGCYAFCWTVDFDALATRRYLEVKFGDAGLKKAGEGDIDSRLNNYFNADRKREDMVVIGRWTDLHRIKRDNDVFDSLALIAPRRVGINEKTGKRQKYEKLLFPVAEAMIQHYVKTLDRSAIISSIFKQIDGVMQDKENLSKTQLIKFRYIQTKVLNHIMQKLKATGFNMSLVAELCPRIGKTIIFLELFKKINKEQPQFKTLFIQTYGVGLSIFKSYRDELNKYKDFAGMDLIDASQADAEQQFKNSQKQNRLQVVLVGLNPDDDSKRYKWMNKYTGSIVSLLEECDFGLHTDSQVGKTRFLNANKKKLIRINASGTNIGRLAKAFGDNVATEVISIPYSMVEQDRDADKNGIVKRKYYNAYFDHKINKLLKDYDAEDLPSIKKIIENAWAQEAWLGAVWGDIWSSSTARGRYGLSISQMAGVDIRYAMAFQSGTKKSMNEHKALIEKYCPEVYVLMLHSDVPGMNNKTAEQLTKEKIVELKSGMILGKSKLLVLTNMMGSRSYTVGEIQAVIFMQDGGDIDTFIQKSSRVLSPHPGKKFGHIFDFAFDPNKTRNSELAIVHDAVLTQNIVGSSFPQAIRQVLQSVNLYDMGRGGWQNDDQLVASLENNNKLLALANSSNRLDIKDLSVQQLEILSKIQNTFTDKEKKKLKHIMTGKTYKSTGRVGKGDVDTVLKQVRKAILALNNSATSVLWFADKQGDTFADCIERIKNNKEASADFIKVIGITPAEVQQLMPILPTNIYDICVKNSRNGQGQKYATNNGLGILGQPDPKELWMEIISQAVMDARIRYAMKNNGKILVIAGGHGSEVDVLVEKYGKEIIKHIWFNDNIVSFVNEIKSKYNKINIVKGDFLSLNIAMKFDVILGNPPYQDSENHGRKLWPIFTHKALDLLNDKGSIGFVIPSGWLESNSSAFKKVRSRLTSEFNLVRCSRDANTYFEVGQDICYIVADKIKYSGSTVYVQNKKTSFIDIREGIPQSQDEIMRLQIQDKILNSGDERLPLEDENDFSADKLSPNRTKTHCNRCIYSTANIGYVDLDLKSKGILKIALNLSSSYYSADAKDNNMPITKDAVGSLMHYYPLKSKKQGMKIKSYLTSKAIRFLVKYYKKKNTGFSHAVRQRKIPKLKEKIWTDKAIYKHFKFTQQEINFIENDIG